MIKLRYINTFSRFKISRKCHSLILCWSIANNYELFQQTIISPHFDTTLFKFLSNKSF